MSSTQSNNAQSNANNAIDSHQDMSIPPIQPIQWVVGYFENENKYSVIPSNWLIMVNNTWFSKWPNSLNMGTVKSNIQNGTEPSKSWKCFPVRTYEKYSTYKEASLREKELFSCSEQSDSGVMVNKKRKKIPSVRLSNFLEDSNSGSSSAEESPVKIIKAKSKSSTPHPRKSLDFNSMPSNIVADHHQSFENFNNSMIFNNNTTLHLGGNTGLQTNPPNFDSLINNSCENFQVTNDDNSIILKSVLEYVKRIDSRLYKIEEELKHGNQNIMQQKPLNDEFVSLFPMKEPSEITNVDLRLENSPEFEKQFKMFMKTISGVKVKNFVKRVLSRLFTNKLAMNCSWCGLQGNFGLQKLRMFSLMNGVCKTIFNDCTDSMFEELVKEWFKHGKQRYFRENKNNNVTSSFNATM
ncbi:homeobox protein 4-like isoform X3 [Melanaphis sacchari]|uniref:homeobox protein 4-like isoform X3 n=1 Tax=Melanaphis sacchari TaxID=742174 RepID=UPI000DC154DA|nr:homeobox protein 4-like isoform X3 [Melanaphis sacchari]